MGGERSRSPKHRDSRRHHKRYYDEDDYKKKSKDKGLEGAKSRLHEKLSTAINDLKDPKYTTTISKDKIDYHRLQSLNLTTNEQRMRQDEISIIESEGFVQKEFKSSRSNKNQQSSSTNLTDHDKAMFGAQWQSKALEKNLKLTEKPEKEKTEEDSKDESNYSLAGEVFFEDPKIRQERWLKLFKERRREVLLNES